MAGQHTPGPWHVDPDWRDDGADQVCQSNGHTVAFCATGMNEDEHAANASLIAAAPELLEACRDVLCAIADDDGAFGIYYDRMRSAVSEVRAAIAKAEGR